MKTMYIELDPWRVLVTKALGTMWRDAYFSPLSPLHFADIPTPPRPPLGEGEKPPGGHLR